VTDVTKPRCDLCVFWVNDCPTAHTGFCCKNPPVVTSDDEPLAAFPLVRDECWCGEFKEKAEERRYTLVTENEGGRKHLKIERHGISCECEHCKFTDSQLEKMGQEEEGRVTLCQDCLKQDLFITHPAADPCPVCSYRQASLDGIDRPSDHPAVRVNNDTEEVPKVDE
jgi:hypothetical protein